MPKMYIYWFGICMLFVHLLLLLLDNQSIPFSSMTAMHWWTNSKPDSSSIAKSNDINCCCFVYLSNLIKGMDRYFPLFVHDKEWFLDKITKGEYIFWFLRKIKFAFSFQLCWKYSFNARLGAANRFIKCFTYNNSGWSNVEILKYYPI